MPEQNYDPEKYWSEVGERIESRREDHNVIAGDDEPYYRYKREQFLKLLSGVDFRGKTVLEVGHGPGGNLKEIIRHHPKQLTGCDISEQMVKLARKHLPPEVELVKINGTELPFADRTFDIVFTATVLQHNTDDLMMKKILGEMCRVSRDRVYLFERIEKEIKGDALCLGRPVDYYAAIAHRHGFELRSKKFINIRTSYYVSGAIRKGLNPKHRKEGEPLTPISVLLQKATLPVTKVLDKIFHADKDVARLEFVRK